MTIASDPNVQIDCDFPGGNILLDRIDGDVVHVHQDLRDTSDHWFYWYFRVQGAAGLTLQFEFNDRAAIGARGPAVSRDRGLTWCWAGVEGMDETSFTFTFADDDDDDEVRFSVGIPYLLADLQRWLAGHQTESRLQVDALCRSRGGAEVPLLTIEPTGEATAGVLLTARHHCCEAMANFVMEGILDAAVADAWFAEQARVAAVPLVDFDGVQAGDQGKLRAPHDHNRDYIENNIYPETRAIRDLVGGWPGCGLTAHVDLHCPWLRGTDWNQHVYQVGLRYPKHWAGQQRFAAILERVHQGVVPYRADGNLPFGEAWNVASTQGEHLSSTRWTGGFTDARFVSSFEIPYAEADGVAMTPDAARELGRSMAASLREYHCSADG